MSKATNELFSLLHSCTDFNCEEYLVCKAYNKMIRLSIVKEK